MQTFRSIHLQYAQLHVSRVYIDLPPPAVAVVSATDFCPSQS